MSKITILEADYSGGTSGWQRCIYRVNISSVKDVDLNVSNGPIFTIEHNAGNISGKLARVQLGKSKFPELQSTHPDFPGGDTKQFDLTSPFAASVASLNNEENTAALRTQFSNNDVVLDPAAVVSIVVASESWSIADGGLTHALEVYDSDDDQIDDAIRVTAEIPKLESELMANQDLAELDLLVRAAKGEDFGVLTARIENLYTPIEDRVKSEYTARYNHYGTDLNP